VDDVDIRCRWCEEWRWPSASPLSGSVTAVHVLGFLDLSLFGSDLVQPTPPLLVVVVLLHVFFFPAV
ncbi:hypothetical protein A2U01_0107204, partial [Trifolium medium]|nr:hypothetical protein [Trifolium medium]